MSDLFANVVADLRAFGEEMLDPGTSPGRSAARPAGSLTLDWTGALVREVRRRLPKILEELRNRPGSRGAIVDVRLPVRARLSRRASSYRSSPSGPLPVLWERIEDAGVIEPGAARWVLSVLEQLDDAFLPAFNRVQKQVEEALETKEGPSHFAVEERDRILELRRRHVDTRRQLDACRALVRRECSGASLARLVQPARVDARSSSGWLSAVSSLLRSPENLLPGLLESLLREPIAMADQPYLYQRWVGLRILEAFAELGWFSRGSPAAAIFLGGCIELSSREGTAIRVWVEPRLTSRRGHPSGLIVDQQRFPEATPDFVLSIDTPRGPEYFVLDATLFGDFREAAARKAKYRERLAAEQPRRIAGVPVIRRPLRAWAATPASRSHCYLHVTDGSEGTIPVAPGEDNPLREWLRDLVREAA